MVSIASAAAAYANAASRGQGPGLAPRTDTSGGDFAGLVKDALVSAKDTIKQGEQLSLDAAAGRATDMTQVVTAVTNAEVALQTVVAVRDKVIQAYQDVLRMPL
jgi:flagellar hook-basal body complex protein FliE